VSDSKRVGIVYRLDRPGGVQSVAISIIKGLNRAGIVPDVIWDVAPDPHLLKSAGAKANFRHIKFPISTLFIDRLPDSLRYLAWIANAIDAADYGLEYDFFYIFFNGFLVPDGTSHLYYLSGRPLLPQLSNPPKGIRGQPFALFNWLYRSFLRARKPVYEYHKQGNYVINSHFTASLFKEVHGVDLPVLHPPIDLSQHHFDSRDLAGRDTLTFFSRIIDYKRPEMVVELASRYPSMRCAIFGGLPRHRMTYLDALRKLAKEKGRADVVFLANPSRERIRLELARTRFFIFPAVDEHFGMTTLEAIASGAVPYVHDSGGQREIVNDVRARFDDGDFYSKFERLAQAPDDQLNDLRMRLLDRISSFSEETFIGKILSFLNESESTASIG